MAALALVAMAACQARSAAAPNPAVSGAAAHGSPSVRGTGGAATPHHSAAARPRLTGLAAILAKLPTFGSPPAPTAIKLPGGATAPVYYRLPVTAKVAFLTIDDGVVRMPKDLEVMRVAHIPFTMFLIGPVGASDPTFFKALEGYGGVIEDHTMTHPELPGKSYTYQKHQICGAKSTLTRAFGAAPTLFRPPYGDYDRTTLAVVHDCGLAAAFDWSETVRNGKVFYQTADHRIRPGDIILMHFRDTFPQDVLAALTAIHRAGLTPALLEDYVALPA